MQPQGHLQMIANMVDFELNPQEALDAPRWQWLEGRKVGLEQGVENHIIKGTKSTSITIKPLTGAGR